MSVATINKALTAGFGTAAAVYFEGQDKLGATRALVPALVAGLVMGIFTWAVPNGKADDMAKLARQIMAAMHIAKVVANTPPVPSTPSPMISPNDAATQLLQQIPKG